MSERARSGVVASMVVGATLVIGGVVAHAQIDRGANLPKTITPPPSTAAPAATVKITIITVPSQKGVQVLWGKKRLGVIAPHQPLILQRPRDSGPLDLLIKCEGFVTVQTRAYTFADSKLAVKITPLDQKNTILGYREEVLPTPDAGVPPATSTLAPPPGAAPPPGLAAPRADAGAR